MAEYIDCEIYITDYDRALLRASDRECPGHPAFSKEALQKLREVRHEPVEYGAALFNSLFPQGDKMLACYRKALGIAKEANKRLRFRLHIDSNAPTEIHLLDWELLYDPEEKIALSRSIETAFSRYLSVDMSPPPLLEIRPRLLVVISSPSDLVARGLAPIDRADIQSKLESALRPLVGTMYCEFLEGPSTPARIRDRLLSGGFHAIHIQGHGHMIKGASELVLEKNDGTSHFIDESIFPVIFEGIRDLRLVMLIACKGGMQSQADPCGGLAKSLVSRGFPAVVAMNESISVDGAVRFVDRFYSMLASTGLVDAAANEARQDLFLATVANQDFEWSVPTLFMRLKAGKIWDYQRRIPQVNLPEADQNAVIDGILTWLRRSKVIPILGPGINENLLPPYSEITEYWSERYNYRRYNYPINDRNDLPRVAKLVETMRGLKIPHNALLDHLKEFLLGRMTEQQRERLKNRGLDDVVKEAAQENFKPKANSPHQILARLPISTYIATTPDTFMAEALKIESKSVQPLTRCLWRGSDEVDKDYESIKGTLDERLVFHMFGYDEDSLIITEDDFLEFLRVVSRDSWRIPLGLRSTLTESMLLFLGFNIRDFDFRIFFKGVVDQLKDIRRERVAILQLPPDLSRKERLEEKREIETFLAKDLSNLKIQVLWTSIEDFLNELYNQGGF